MRGQLKGADMRECWRCKHSEMDCFEYYGTTDKEWFVCDCRKCNDIDSEEECEDYDEWAEEDPRD